ncbi:MAG: serine/threonine-protein phosphatase [bacterium]|nr:serine/threonine-protein phosphatase [bacterium]
MHPILGQRGRLLLYLAIWLPVGGLLSALVALLGQEKASAAVALAMPLALVYAFICLSSWYPSRGTPLSSANAWRVVTNHAAAAVISSCVWQLAVVGWASVLARLPLFAGAYIDRRQLVLLFFSFGLLLYLLSAAGSYLYIAFEASYEAEKRALEARKSEELAARELELARSLQRRLLPPAERSGKGFRLAARNLAAQWVAGDFYDYFRLPDGRLRIAVADVSGKGMSASLIMATVKAVLPLIAAERSVVEALRELNRKLAGELGDREFVALALAGYDPETGHLELANAGLPDPYLIHGDGRQEIVDPEGRKRNIVAIEAPQPRLPLGLRAEVDYQSVEVELAEGDRVLFLTDGLPEALIAAGEPLGYEALVEFLAQPRAEDTGQWLDELIELVRGATLDEQSDDWTALLLEQAARA